MNNLQVEARQRLIQRQSLPAPFSGEMLRPSYDGLGLPNVTSLAMRLIGVEDKTLVPPVNPALLGKSELTAAFDKILERAPVNHVIVFLIDALGYDQLTAELRNLVTLKAACEDADSFFMPLTSVYPSTTTTALTSVATAQPPQAHGVLGTTIYLSEIGTQANLIHFTPAFDHDVKAFNSRTLDPDKLVLVPNVYKLAEDNGHKAFIVNYYQFENSSISRYTSADSQAKYIGYNTPSVGFAKLRHLVNDLPSDGSSRSFTYGYVPTIDQTAHSYGPLSEEYRAELAMLDFSLGKELFEQVQNRPDVLFILVADHGQRVINTESVLMLHEHPDFVKRYLAMPVTGERRAVYMHIKNGKVVEAKAYLEANFAEGFVTLTAEEALNLGFFGDIAQSAPAPQTLDRIGDLVLFPKGDWTMRQFFTAQNKGYGLIGVHGGLSPEEMLIPFLMKRLG
jgi:Type I phosphodiesterase / nucleotide pyrophosphatase